MLQEVTDHRPPPPTPKLAISLAVSFLVLTIILRIQLNSEQLVGGEQHWVAPVLPLGFCTTLDLSHGSNPSYGPNYSILSNLETLSPAVCCVLRTEKKAEVPFSGKKIKKK